MEISDVNLDGIFRECLSKEVTFEQSPDCSEGESCIKSLSPPRKKRQFQADVAASTKSLR